MVFYPENIIVYSKSSKNSFHSLYASGGEGRNIYYICKTVKPGARGSFLYLASQTETEFGVSLSCLMVSCNFSLQTVGPLVLSIPGPRDLVDLKSHNPNLLALPIGTQDPGREACQSEHILLPNVKITFTFRPKLLIPNWIQCH